MFNGLSEVDLERASNPRPSPVCFPARTPTGGTDLDALANRVQPFWMLPILGLFQLRARDVMGYTFAVFLVPVPVVLLLVTILGATLPYPL